MVGWSQSTQERMTGAQADATGIAPEGDKESSPAHVEDTEQRPAEPEKLGHHGDTALALFAQGNAQYEAIDPAENKKLVRKIDMMILPLLSVCYAFYYVRSCLMSPIYYKS